MSQLLAGGGSFSDALSDLMHYLPSEIPNPPCQARLNQGANMFGNNGQLTLRQLMCLLENRLTLKKISPEDAIIDILKDLEAGQLKSEAIAARSNASDFHSICARIENISQSSRTLALKSKTFEQAFLVILRDPHFQRSLRLRVGHGTDAKGVDRLLNLIETNDPLRAETAFSKRWFTRGILSRRVRRRLAANSDTNSTLMADSLEPRHATSAREDAMPFDDVAFEYQVEGAAQKATISDLVLQLTNYKKDGALENMLAGLYRSENRFQLLALYEYYRRNQTSIRVPQPAQLSLKIYAVRVLVQLNAFVSAETLASEMLSDQNLKPLISSGELRRLKTLLAKCALRSGRRIDAEIIFRQLTVDYPDKIDVIINYIGTAAAENMEVARQFSKIALLGQYELSANDLILIGDVLAQAGEHDLSSVAYYRSLRINPKFADCYLGLANLELTSGRVSGWQRLIARYLSFNKISNVTFSSDAPYAPFSITINSSVTVKSSSRVTIIMTTFNSESTVELAIASVMQQSVSNIELIVVDDCSSDGTREILRRLGASDPRIKLIFNSRNVGTYVSKNSALQASSGDFVTFHDSDDWMHPMRLERHLSSMSDAILCSTSRWIRMTADGRCLARRGGAYTHLNPASTFYRRTLLEEIGGFDNVRVGADSELLARTRHARGPRSIKNLNDCLAIGLSHDSSLTQSGAAAVDEFRYSPPRLEYTEAWLRWHLDTALAATGSLKILSDEPRKFAVPASILP